MKKNATISRSQRLRQALGSKCRPARTPTALSNGYAPMVIGTSQKSFTPTKRLAQCHRATGGFDFCCIL